MPGDPVVAEQILARSPVVVSVAAVLVPEVVVIVLEVVVPAKQQQKTSEKMHPQHYNESLLKWWRGTSVRRIMG